MGYLGVMDVGSLLRCAHRSDRRAGRRFTSTFFVDGKQDAGSAGPALPAEIFRGNRSNTPIDVIESQTPVRVGRRGTGGHRRNYDGDGQVFEFVFLADSATAVSTLAARLGTSAPGLQGGGSGEMGRVLLDGVPVDPREILIVQPGAWLA